MQLRFCPSCGNRLPEADEQRFCLSCGVNLARFTISETEKIQLHSNSRVPRNASSYGISSATQEDSDYSVVLKTTGNKELLVKKLCGVLRRGTAAIRMAVDMVPCIIVYKSKASDVSAVVDIFKEEHLHYCVAKGDIATERPIEKILPGFFEMHSELQLLFRSIPPMLWFGERFDLVLPEVMMDEKKGVLAVSDHGLFFFRTTDNKHFDWHIISYHDLADVDIQPLIGELECVHLGGEREILRISSAMQLREVLKLVHRSMDSHISN